MAGIDNAIHTAEKDRPAGQLRCRAHCSRKRLHPHQAHKSVKILLLVETPDSLNDILRYPARFAAVGTQGTTRRIDPQPL